MAANGTLSPPALPPAPASPSIAKRKLSATHSLARNGASASGPGQSTDPSSDTYPLQMVLEDILAILKSYDTKPSILNHPIASSIPRSPSGEADSKRTKLTPPTGPANILGLIQDASYTSLQALEKHVELAATEILASITSADSSMSPPTPEEMAVQAKVLAFQKVAKSLVDKEEERRLQKENRNTEMDDEIKPSKEEGTPPIFIKEEEPHVPQSRTVLTLYGSAPPKQLFSSLQQPRQVSPADGSMALDTAVKIVLPLREANLPNMISTTEVYPLPDPDDSKKKKPATIGETFRAPAHLAQISPPKSTRPTTSKGNNTITFAPQEAPKPRRKTSQSYAHQNLSSGFWLGYGGVDMPREQISPTAKQKSRQRALSMGESQQPPSEAILVAVQHAKEDAMFRSAYSSFAPTRDDAQAIVPEETKNMVWWQRVGEKRFNEMFPIDPALLDSDQDMESAVNGAIDEDEDFKAAVENFIPIEGEPFPETEDKSEEEKDTDELLKDISELLETLASYQRIRNSSLTTNPRTPVVQNSSLAILAGSPSTPSTEEIDVYEILKSQLTLLISQLPPYAVAKLNGDQMDELCISRTILFDTKEYKGVLEEDQLSRLAKAPPVVAPTPGSLSRSSSGAHSLYPPGGGQFGRSAPSIHQSGSRPVYAQQQSLHRSSSMHLQRSPSGTNPNFQAGGASYAPASRPGFPATPTFSHNAQRPSYGSTASGQYYPQRSAQPNAYGSSGNSQYYNSTPQTQSQNRYASQSTQNGYYSRSQNVAPMYGTTQTPMKGGAAQSSSRVNYSTPSGGQMRSTYYGASQYGASQAPSTPGLHSGMSTSAQQMMIDRQQAQMAAQSQARMAAQNSFSNRQGSGTPQPSNGSYGVNGMSMSS